MAEGQESQRILKKEPKKKSSGNFPKYASLILFLGFLLTLFLYEQNFMTTIFIGPYHLWFNDCSVIHFWDFFSLFSLLKKSPSKSINIVCIHILSYMVTYIRFILFWVFSLHFWTRVVLKMEKSYAVNFFGNYFFCYWVSHKHFFWETLA